MREHNPKLAVAKGYDRVAEGYARRRAEQPVDRDHLYLDRLTEGLGDRARVLDLGCGAGVPIAAYLSERFDTVGVDISSGQIELARRNVASGTFLLCDMCSLPFKPASFDAIVASYSIIHVPRDQHEPLLGDLRGLLRPGGRLLATLGHRAWEGSERDWLGLGAEMWLSHFGAEAYLAMFERLDFALVESSIVDDPLGDGGAHLFVLAERAS